MNELENPNQKRSKPSTPVTERPHTLRNQQRITINTSSEEVFETPTKHKKGKEYSAGFQRSLLVIRFNLFKLCYLKCKEKLFVWFVFNVKYRTNALLCMC